MAAAETAIIPPQRVDLLTVAQSLQGFDLTPFWPVCHRSLKPNGILAAWGYLLPSISPPIDDLVQPYHDPTVGPFWLNDRTALLEGYAQIVPPATELPAPEFRMKANRALPQLVGMLDSWSATPRARAHTKQDSLAPLISKLQTAWGPALTQPISWPLVLRVFRFRPSCRLPIS